MYEALRHLSRGFLDHPSNDLPSNSPDGETLRQVYDASLIVLYRLLFVLYAEFRGLLPPAESEQYRNVFSLNKIKHEVSDNLDRGHNLRASGATLRPRLKELFNIIDEGRPRLTPAVLKELRSVYGIKPRPHRTPDQRPRSSNAASPS